VPADTQPINGIKARHKMKQPSDRWQTDTHMNDERVKQLLTELLEEIGQGQRERILKSSKQQL